MLGLNAFVDAQAFNDLKGYALCRQPLLVPRGCHLGGSAPPFWHHGRPFWHLGSIREAILGPRDRLGGPRERQDGHEVVWNRIFIGFGLTLGPVYISLMMSRSLKFHFLSGLFPRYFFIVF